MTGRLASLEAPLAIPGKSLGLAVSRPALACNGNLHHSGPPQVRTRVDFGLTEQLALKAAKLEGRKHANRNQIGEQE